ncbi:hypothetical protein BDV40DRAFT_255682 [Aspergillus tamarii]|uniref:Secreted protein n=1 Tax=Aspergillus tamarii TaxID=41984 RepID=A0A5N6V621_ASPTM|nr:hypothetical protein BDV40DRAFT_255682 [Aspergillus tamarii]
MRGVRLSILRGLLYVVSIEFHCPGILANLSCDSSLNEDPFVCLPIILHTGRIELRARRLSVELVVVRRFVFSEPWRGNNNQLMKPRMPNSCC